MTFPPPQHQPGAPEPYGPYADSFGAATEPSGPYIQDEPVGETRSEGPYDRDPWVLETRHRMPVGREPGAEGAYAPEPNAQEPWVRGMPGGFPGLQPQTKQPFNGLAVASFVAALCLLVPLGLAFGIVALVQISRTGRRGKGLAVAGVTISGVVFSTVVALLLTGALSFRVWVVDGPGLPSATGRPDGSRVHISVLREGDCFTPAEIPTSADDRVVDASAERMPCTESHRGEIYAAFQLPDAESYPGTEQVVERAHKACGELLFEYTPDPAAHGPLATFFYFPRADRWALGDRTVLCWAGPPLGELDRSVRQDIDELTSGQRAYVHAMLPLGKAQALRPIKSPEQDLAGARKWAEEVAAAQRETSRLLANAAMPAAEASTAKELAEALERDLRRWGDAAGAETSEAFRSALQRTAGERGVLAGLERELRTGLGLPIAGAAS